jgi:hypothetical protein
LAALHTALRIDLRLLTRKSRVERWRRELAALHAALRTDLRLLT